MSKLTQIPLDFGPEDQSKPPAGQGGNGSGDETGRQYIAAEGVGVRIRYKRPAAPSAEGGLFEEAVPGPADVPSPVSEDGHTDGETTIEDIPSADEGPALASAGPDHPAVQRVAPSKTSRSA